MSDSYKVIVKIGGSIIDEEEVLFNIIIQVVELHKQENKVILVHGGGKIINQKLKKSGISPKFYQGQRITDDATMEVVSKVLGEDINSRLAKLISEQGAKPIYGENSHILHSEPWQEEGTNTLGRVGRVVKVDELNSLDENITVIAPIAKDIHSGLDYNINADWAAAEIALSFEADYLVYVTDQDGILDKNSQVIRQISIKQIDKLVEDGTISEGMIPKVLSFKKALSRGLKQIKLINGFKSDSLVSALGDKSSGTKIVP